QGLSRVNLGDMLTFRARCQLELGRDPLPSLRAAIESIQGGVERMPDQAFPRAYLSLAYAWRARWELDARRDAGASITAALEAAQAAMERNAAESMAYLARGTAKGLRARALARRGQARASDFDEALADLARSVELQDDNEPRMEAARLDL